MADPGLDRRSARYGRARRSPCHQLLRRGRQAVDPDPRGLFAIDEPIRQPAGSELGPWALFLTAHSRVLDDYGGGPGRIAIHGRAGPLLADPPRLEASHGCVRIPNAKVSWLSRVAEDGTPVEVVR